MGDDNDDDDDDAGDDDDDDDGDGDGDGDDDDENENENENGSGNGNSNSTSNSNSNSYSGNGNGNDKDIDNDNDNNSNNNNDKFDKDDHKGDGKDDDDKKFVGKKLYDLGKLRGELIYPNPVRVVGLSHGNTSIKILNSHEPRASVHLAFLSSQSNDVSTIFIEIKQNFTALYATPFDITIGPTDCRRWAWFV